MLTVTTPSIEGKMIETHYGIVSGGAIVGGGLDYETFGESMPMVSA